MVVRPTAATIADNRQGIAPRPRLRAKRRRNLTSTTIAAYGGVFLLVVSMVAIGYQSPQKADSVANAVTPQATVTQANLSDQQQPSIDQLVATNVAADIAERADLSVAPNLANLSVSLSIDNQLAQTASTNVISKPQIVQPTASGRAIRTYTTKAGDTVTAIAAQFGVSSNTIKWANNLQTDALDPNQQLTILPVDGILYTVKAGDTVASLASKYSASSDQIVLFNDLELNSTLTPGNKIIIPGGILPNSERPGYVAPQQAVAPATSYAYTATSYGAGFGGQTWRIKVGTPMYPGNGYAFGNCTAYAYDRRVELGLPVGGNWGNASSWAYSARAAGLVVNNTPSVGAIMQNGGGYGHVAIVEQILPNGNLSISEMNAYVPGGGFDIVSGRIIAAADVGSYSYIH